MIEKITRIAVTAPSFAKSPKSRRPKVDKSGAWAMAAGIRPAPGVENPWPAAKTSLSTIAITVVARMPISSAPRPRRARSEERRVGKECRRLCRSRWAECPSEKKLRQELLRGRLERAAPVAGRYACLVVFFFKQRTAYEITYGDWSSDVCSSDLVRTEAEAG